MMPATGPRNLRLAGSLADRVMLYVGVEDELRALGDGARSRRRRGSRTGHRRGQVLAPHGDVGQRRPGRSLGQVPLGAGRVRESHRGHDEAQPVARHAGHDDPPGAEPRRLRLLRGPSLVGRRPHRVPDGRADRRLHARRPGGEGARARQSPLRARNRRDLVRLPQRRLRADGDGGPRDHPGTVATDRRSGP